MKKYSRKWRLDIYYAKKNESEYEKVTEEQLADKAGRSTSSQVLREANIRMEYRTIPEVKEFFKNGGKQIILTCYTNRGNVYIEAVEII